MEINSIVKAIKILNCFRPEELELSAVQISKKLDMPLTTTIRILTTLTNHRMLERKKLNRKYTIGPEMYRLGSFFLMSADLIQVADPVVKELNEITKEVVTVAIRDQDKIIIILREESKFSIALHIHPGSVLPAHTTSMGKAFLSELTEHEIEKLYSEEILVKRTAKTIATKTELKLELERIRQTGVSFSHEESHQGNIGVASLIRDASGKSIASIAIGVPVFRINETIESKLATLIRMAASLISYRLGYHEIAAPVTDIEQIRSWWGKEGWIVSPLESMA